MKTVFLTTIAGVVLAKFAAPMISRFLGRPISA